MSKMDTQGITVPKRMQNAFDDGVFKAPIPRRPQIQNQPEIKQSNLVINGQQILKMQMLMKQQIQRRQEQQKLIEKYQIQNQVRSLFRWKNYVVLLFRFKHLAYLPQYQNSTFNKPEIELMPNYKQMNLQEIDDFIFSNKLIVSNQPIKIFNEDSKDIGNDQNTLENEAQVLTRIQKKAVRLVQFKIPEKYFADYDEEDFNSFENSSDSTGISSDQENELKNKIKTRIGAYSFSERSKRILKYKEKIYKRRASKPISKVFKGRSQVASQKLRVNGKFVKKCDQQ